MSNAKITISEAFDVEVDPFPSSVYSEDWTVGYRAGNTQAIVLVDQHGLKIRRATDSSMSATVYYNGEHRQTPITSASATIRLSKTMGASWVGFYVGGSSTHYNTPGWFIGINPAGALLDKAPEVERTGLIGVWKNPANYNNLYNTNLAPVKYTRFSAQMESDIDYKVELEIIDQTTIIGRVLNGAVLLGEVSYTLEAGESINPEGYFGWRASYADQGVDTWISDLEFTVVPEPGYAVVVMALLALLTTRVLRGRY